MIVAVPDLPSLVATIVVFPTETPVTNPEAETVAIFESDDVHAIVRPVNVRSSASCAIAVSCLVAPISTIAELGFTVTRDTGTGSTVRVAVAVLPSLVALISAVPTTIGVTTPVFEIVAFDWSDELHSTALPVSTFPDASVVSAFSCNVEPSPTVGVAGIIATRATGIGIVKEADPVLPSL
jgi:hypothetical protein